MTNIGIGGTVVSVSSASLVTITFQNTLGGAVEPAFVATSSLVPGTAAVNVVTAPAINATTGLPSLAGTTGLSGTQVGGVVSGPLGIGIFYMFGNGGEGFPGGLNGSQNGGSLSVGNSNSPTTAAQVVPSVTLHSQVIMQDSNFQLGGSAGIGPLYNGGGNVVLAGPLTLQGNNDFYITNNQLFTVSGQVSGDGSIMLFGDQNYTGALNMSGDNAAWSGGVTNWAFNTLIIGNNSALGSGLYDWPGGLLEDDGDGTGGPSGPQGPTNYTINNPLELDNGGKTNNFGVSAGSTLTFNGTIIDAGPFQKVGGGNLVLTNAVVQTGRDTISDGTLTLSGGGSIAAGNSIVVNPNATLTLDNTGTNSGSRIGSAIPITLNGGTFNFIGNTSPFAISSQTIGGITLGAGDSTISISSGPAGSSTTSTLSIGNITRNPGAILTFVGNGTPIGVLNTAAAPYIYNQININGPILGTTTSTVVTPTNFVVPTTNSVITASDPNAGTPEANPLDNSAFIPFATVNDSSGFDFAGVPTTLGVPVTPSPATPYIIEHYSDYVTGGLTASTLATDVVKLTATDPAGSDTMSTPGGQNVAGVLLAGDGLGTASDAAAPLGIGSAGQVLTIGQPASEGAAPGSVGAIIASSEGGPAVLGDAFSPNAVLDFPEEALLISNTSVGMQIPGEIISALSPPPPVV